MQALFETQLNSAKKNTMRELNYCLCHGDEPKGEWWLQIINQKTNGLYLICMFKQREKCQLLLGDEVHRVPTLHFFHLAV